MSNISPGARPVPALPLVVGLTLVGTGLRVWGLSNLGLIHFDEGVYGSSGSWFLDPIYETSLYPKQMLYSPPLFVSLIGLAYRLLGEASDRAAILVNVVMGGATIPLVWWLAKRWFGSDAGVIAAVLVALSDYHIAYSRMALTDVAFVFFFLLSLGWITVTWETGSMRWAVISGLAVGAAWNTKYHGWMPLIIAFIVLLGFVTRAKSDRWRLKRLLGCWFVMASVATLCYLPWVLYVEMQEGGYFALMKYQRHYLSLAWLKNLWRQTEMQLYMDGLPSRIAPALAYLLAITVRGQPRRLEWISIGIVFLVLLGSGIVLGGVTITVAFTLSAIPILVRRGTSVSWFLLCSVAVLLLSTPFYRPYSRLLMPLVLAVYIAAGAGIGAILVAGTAQWSRENSSSVAYAARAFSGVGIVLLGVLALVLGFRPAPRTWMATESLREAATAMAGMLPRDSVVFVHGEPAVAFYLRLAGRRAIPIDYPIDHPKFTARYSTNGEKMFLVTGIYAQHRDPVSRASLKRLEDRLRPLRIFPVQPNDVRLLDDFTPRNALHYRFHPTGDYDLHLYKIGSPLQLRSQP